MDRAGEPDRRASFRVVSAGGPIPDRVEPADVGLSGGRREFLGERPGQHALVAVQFPAVRLVHPAAVRAVRVGEFRPVVAVAEFDGLPVGPLDGRRVEVLGRDGLDDPRRRGARVLEGGDGLLDCRRTDVVGALSEALRVPAEAVEVGDQAVESVGVRRTEAAADRGDGRLEPLFEGAGAALPVGGRVVAGVHVGGERRVQVEALLPAVALLGRGQEDAEILR